MAKRGNAATDPPHFRVSPEVLGPLGTEQLQDPALAVLELIKNSWDADAKRVTVEVRTKGTRKIIVEDNGSGMSSGDFKNRWLVIGSSYKRTEKVTPGGRPYIGEKGLGRLATFALGRVIKIDSVQGADAFSAEVDWGALRRAPSLEEYPIKMAAGSRRKGTRIEIRDLSQDWTTKHTDFLISHAEFLTAIPGTGFHTTISIDSHKQILGRSQDQISRLAEATFEMEVEADGVPKVTCCIVNGVDWTGRIDYRALHPKHVDKRLAGVKLSMMFFRRDDLEKRLGSRGQSLQRNFVKNVLERYQGIRIYRDGINVPPYGINADDWASLERQRTRTGGPTMVPGNTQLIGELHISRDKQSHLVVTAGRSGFADQQAVASMAEYVRWGVRALATARRADVLKITDRKVPGRVDQEPSSSETTPPPEKPAEIVGSALSSVAESAAVKQDPALRELVDTASKKLLNALEKSEEMLRLYAQLASTGIAATSFAHELRAEFDIITEAVEELSESAKKADREVTELLSKSWSRVKAFAALFQLVPVKMRRRTKLMTSQDMTEAALAISGLAIPDKVETRIREPDVSARIVPAEFDSILVNLFSNAVKAINASSNRESGKIDVVLEPKGTDLEMRVADNGCGISDNMKQVMFEPVEGAFAEGTGMGLPIVQFLASRYGGTVALTENPPSGFATEFKVILRDVVDKSA